ncbi:MAG: hemin uptake protein HemP [Hydrogenophilales bacterium]|nr:hemin uptake protein HemP [Hydrogenophilales bacterium]
MTNRDICSGSTPETPRKPAIDERGVINAKSLFVGGDVVLIEYRGEHYQLRRTKAGKLVLTK